MVFRFTAAYLILSAAYLILSFENANSLYNHAIIFRFENDFHVVYLRFFCLTSAT